MVSWIFKITTEMCKMLYIDNVSYYIIVYIFIKHIYQTYLSDIFIIHIMHIIYIYHTYITQYNPNLSLHMIYTLHSWGIEKPIHIVIKPPRHVHMCRVSLTQWEDSCVLAANDAGHLLLLLLFFQLNRVWFLNYLIAFCQICNVRKLICLWFQQMKLNCVNS